MTATAVPAPLRILYLEDDAADVDLVRRELARAMPAAQLRAVPTLAEARELLHDGDAAFDVLLADLNLPDGSGLELIVELRTRGLPLAIVALTGDGDETVALTAMKSGADDYLAKSPSMPMRLPATLQAALHRFRSETARQARPLSVLYVEHDAQDFDLTRRHLARHAGHVGLQLATDAVAARALLDAARDGGSPFDVLLVDYRLNGASGLDLLKHVREDLGLDLPFVLVTGQGSEDAATQAMRLGATDYLVKHENYLVALPAVLESAFHRVQAAREQAALRELNASLEGKVRERTAELAAAKEAAESASRGKSAFLARMSHDLRTPLNAVIGFSQLLALNPVLAASDGARVQVQRIREAGEHLLAMIDEMLDLARIEAGGLRLDLQPVDGGQLVQDGLGLLGPLAAQHGVELVRVAQAGPCWVRADRTRLRQVLVNLLTNAIKYNRPGGQVRVALSESDGVVRIDVVDDGPGLTPQQQQALFQPFNRLGAEARGVEGTGLGLVIARQLVEAMHGRLAVASAPGSGSTFSVELGAIGPGCTPERASADDASGAAPPVARLRRILHVEDNPVNLILVRAMLERLPGVELRETEDGHAALAEARAWQPDLVLLDLGLPGLSGLEVLRRLKADASTAGIPCVIVSAYAMGPEIRQALDAGASAYLTKPFGMQRLFEAVDRFTT